MDEENKIARLIDEQMATENLREFMAGGTLLIYQGTPSRPGSEDGQLMFKVVIDKDFYKPREKTMKNLPELHKVKSSNIDNCGYDKESKTLVVTFKNGGLYKFPGVKEEAFNEFLGAESPGKHFHKEIRGKYDSEKIVEEDDLEKNPTEKQG